MEVGTAYTAQSEAVEAESTVEVFSYKHENGQVMTARSAQELGHCAFFGSMESEEQRIFMARQFMLGQCEQEAKVEEEPFDQENENPEDSQTEIENAADDSQDTEPGQSKKGVNKKKPGETVVGNTNAEADNSNQNAAQEIPSPGERVATGAQTGNDIREVAPEINAPSAPTEAGARTERDLKSESATIDPGLPSKTKSEARIASVSASQGTKRVRNTHASTKESDKASSSLDTKSGYTKPDTKLSQQKSGRVANKNTGGINHKDTFEPADSVAKEKTGDELSQPARRQAKLNKNQPKGEGYKETPTGSQLPHEKALEAAAQTLLEVPKFNGIEFVQGDEAEDNEPLEVSGIDAGEVTGDSANRIPEDEDGASDFQAKEIHAGAAEDVTQGQEESESNPLLSIPDKNSPDPPANNLEREDYKDNEGFYNPIINEKTTTPAAHEVVGKEIGEADIPIEEVEGVLQTLEETIEDMEIEEAQEVHQILDEVVVKASELRARTEAGAETPEAPIETQTKEQEELKELFIELFDYAEIEYTPELIDSFVKLSIKNSENIEELIEEVENEEQDIIHDRGTHEVIKQLLIAVSNMKKAVMHACSIGKSALQLYSQQLA